MAAVIFVGHTFENDSPGGEESLEQGDTGETRVLSIVWIQSEQNWLDGQVSKTVSGCRKHIGDAGVNIRAVAGVTSELSAHCIRTNYVRKIIPEDKNLIHKSQNMRKQHRL